MHIGPVLKDPSLRTRLELRTLEVLLCLPQNHWSCFDCCETTTAGGQKCHGVEGGCQRLRDKGCRSIRLMTWGLGLQDGGRAFSSQPPPQVEHPALHQQLVQQQRIPVGPHTINSFNRCTDTKQCSQNFTNYSVQAMSTDGCSTVVRHNNIVKQ